MTNKNSKRKVKNQRFVFAISLGLVISLCLGFCGCTEMSGYSNQRLRGDV
jgi:hypothetical protein